MDFLFNQFALFVICLIGLIAFAVYSIRAVRRVGITRYLISLLWVVKSILGTVVGLIMGLVGFLAASTKTSDANDATANAATSGILNHRTGKFDDGTDPAGWYEND